MGLHQFPAASSKATDLYISSLKPHDLAIAVTIALGSPEASPTRALFMPRLSLCPHKDMAETKHLLDL